MDTTLYMISIAIIILLLTLSNRNEVLKKKILKKRNQEEKREMVELSKRFLDKECIVRTFNGGYFTGFIKEVSENAVLIENNGDAEIVNLEYVISIKEYPKNKKGKKKALVL
ncbi:MAG: hypothetical protein U0L20_00265 [Ruminococcus sp.]|nr:hypothetical protein [Ruminococcus sp.]